MTTPAETTAPKKKSNTMLYAGIIIVIIIAGVAAFLLFGGGGQTCANTLTVNAEFTSSAQTNYTFNPTTPAQYQGCVKITWKSNTGSITHTVTATSANWMPFDFDQFLGPGQDVTHTFTSPGTYTYKCTPHPWMIGTITIV